MGVEPRITLDLPKKSQKHWGFGQETLEFTEETRGDEARQMGFNMVRDLMDTRFV